MGLVWAQPKPVKNATTILINAKFPKIDTLKAQLWNLWRQHKQALKDDGFSVNKYKNMWYVNYFNEIEPDSYDQVDSAGGRIPKFLDVFNKKYVKWKQIQDNLDPNAPEPSEDPWFYEESDEEEDSS
jgi:hypothetical protein